LQLKPDDAVFLSVLLTTADLHSSLVLCWSRCNSCRS